MISKNSEEWVDLTKDMIVCELCSKCYTPEEFYEHLKEHSREEILILKELAKKTMNMTSEQYREFLTNLECESYREARDSIETEEKATEEVQDVSN